MLIACYSKSRSYLVFTDRPLEECKAVPWLRARTGATSERFNRLFSRRRFTTPFNLQALEAAAQCAKPSGWNSACGLKKSA
jgi:hypothetical protein